MSDASRYPEELTHFLAGNSRMIGLITRFTTIAERKLDQGVVEMTFTTGTQEAPVERFSPLIVGSRGGLFVQEPAALRAAIA